MKPLASSLCAQIWRSDIDREAHRRRWQASALSSDVSTACPPFYSGNILSAAVAIFTCIWSTANRAYWFVPKLARDDFAPIAPAFTHDIIILRDPPPRGLIWVFGLPIQGPAALQLRQGQPLAFAFVISEDCAAPA